MGSQGAAPEESTFGLVEFIRAISRSPLSIRALSLTPQSFPQANL